MSAPDPEKWKVTEAECVELHDTCYEDWNGDNMDHAVMANICERFARRRAIEELKAFAAKECRQCAAGAAYSSRSHPFANLGYSEVCTAYELRDRIAAIEAEEA